jgi:hypothetical protein
MGGNGSSDKGGDAKTAARGAGGRTGGGAKEGLEVLVRQRPWKVEADGRLEKGFVGFRLDHLVTPEVLDEAVGVINAHCSAYERLDHPRFWPPTEPQQPPTTEAHHLTMGHGFRDPAELARANRMLRDAGLTRDDIKIEGKIILVGGPKTWMPIVKLAVSQRVLDLYDKIYTTFSVEPNLLSNAKLKPHLTLMYAVGPTPKIGAAAVPLRIPENF